MSDGLLFVLVSLAVFRIWRLLGRDDITEGLRAHLPNWPLKLVSCPWCLGSWLSFAAVWGVDRNLVEFEPNWWWWAFAVAAIVGLVGEIDRKLID